VWSVCPRCFVYSSVSFFFFSTKEKVKTYINFEHINLYGPKFNGSMKDPMHFVRQILEYLLMRSNLLTSISAFVLVCYKKFNVVIKDEK